MRESLHKYIGIEDVRNGTVFIVSFEPDLLNVAVSVPKSFFQSLEQQSRRECRFAMLSFQGESPDIAAYDGVGSQKLEETALRKASISCMRHVHSQARDALEDEEIGQVAKQATDESQRKNDLEFVET